MKNRQFFTIVALIIIGFSIVIHQNNRILSYGKVLDYRTIDIYKDTWNTDTILKDLDEIKSTLRATWWAFTNNPTINPEKYN